jgi:hypothetical protein
MAGAKALLILLALSARLKSCPVTEPLPAEFFRSLQSRFVAQKLAGVRSATPASQGRACRGPRSGGRDRVRRPDRHPEKSECSRRNSGEFRERDLKKEFRKRFCDTGQHGTRIDLPCPSAPSDHHPLQSEHFAPAALQPELASVRSVQSLLQRLESVCSRAADKKGLRGGSCGRGGGARTGSPCALESKHASARKRSQHTKGRGGWGKDGGIRRWGHGVEMM